VSDGDQLSLGLEVEEPDDGTVLERVLPVRIGTCGWSYQEWVGPFYPKGTKAGDMLGLYAKQFSTVEIDATYYRVLAPESTAAMAERTPPHFRFTVKLPGSATHLPADALELPDIAEFRESLVPLIEADKLGGVLAQFPNAFHPGPPAHRRLRILRETLPDVPFFAEFRHREWQTPETLELLETLDVGYVNVDLPQLEGLPHPSADATGALAYIRFHGRNAEKWWRGSNVTRYAYDYTPAELEPWAHRILDLAANSGAREVYAMFNNHANARAVHSARTLRKLLAQLALPDEA
jgi:uncharacterized protein YecE (DUF72 family)